MKIPANLTVEDLVNAFLDPSDEVLQVHHEVWGRPAPMFFRRAKGRGGDQWEVVRDLDPAAPISDEVFVVHGVYATLGEARAVADKINGRERSRAALRAAALKVLGREG